MNKTTEYVSTELARLDCELRNEQIRHENIIRRMRNRISRMQKMLNTDGKEEKGKGKG